MDYQQHVSELTQWYCRLVKEPGFRDYVLDRTQYMAERQPMYRPPHQAVLCASSSRSAPPTARTPESTGASGQSESRPSVKPLLGR
jgi:hypothetical protein